MLNNYSTTILISIFAVNLPFLSEKLHITVQHTLQVFEYKTYINMLSQSEATPKITTVSQLLMLTGCLMIGLFLIGPLLAFASVLPLFNDLTFKGVQNVIQNPPDTNEGRLVILILQGVTALVGFIATPLLYLRYLERKNFANLSNRSTSIVPIVLSLAAVLVVMPFMSAVIHWNAHLQLPEFLADFELMAKAKEEQLAKLTAFLTNMKNGGEFLFTLLIIAVLPGIGEELVFRGLIQKKFSYLMNPHVAIWLSAFLFSAFHLQFYGLIPRMLLGVLFGYMYYWSGNLWLPILAHFLNNGFTLFMIYLFKEEVVSFDIQKVNYSLLWVLLSMVASVAVLWILFKQTWQISSTKEEALVGLADENN